jgi:hypothetical protein
MDGPGVLDAAGIRLGQRKVGLGHAVSQLKHRAQGHTQCQPCHGVKQQHGPDGVQQHGNQECQGKEPRFAGNKAYQAPPLGAREAIHADPPGEDVSEIAIELPAHRHQPVKRPEIIVLPAMHLEALLVRRHPAQDAKVHVDVVARDVDVCVMGHAMGPVPDVGAGANHIQRHRHQLVDPRVVGIGLMTAVVLNVEADGGRGQAEQERKRHGLPPRLGHEHQQRVRSRKSGEQNRRLDVHLRAIALPQSRALEKRIDPSTQLDLKTVVLAEFQRRAGFWAFNRLIRGVPLNVRKVCHGNTTRFMRQQGLRGIRNRYLRAGFGSLPLFRAGAQDHLQAP